jgi:membrane-associated protein
MSILDPESIISGGGLLLIAFIIFAESGLLFGFFFPGDTLLFAAGLIASQGDFSLLAVVTVIVISAIAGGQVGYIIGHRAGPRLFKKKDGIIFRKEYVEQAELFYEKHGGKTIVLARFVPVVRTFAPVVAGIGNMNLKKFTLYNMIGSAIWGISITILGYYFGSKIPNIDTYILPIIGAAMIFSFAPTIYHIVRDPKSRQKIRAKLTGQ